MTVIFPYKVDYRRFCGRHIYALVAQLDRVSDSDSEGRWFESSQARQRAEKFSVNFSAFFKLSPMRYFNEECNYCRAVQGRKDYFGKAAE